MPAETGAGVARHRGAGATSALTGVGLVAAVTLRSALGGDDPAASAPSAVVFAGVALALAVAAGWRPGTPNRGAVAAGIAGAAVLTGAWLVARGAPGPLPTHHVGALVAWTPTVAAVAVAEELLLRGAMFEALSRWRGDITALSVTTLAFGLMHVPLYGVGALPLDLAVGLFLGGLRLTTGGVAAPAVAHVLTDLAGGWLA